MGLFSKHHSKNKTMLKIYFLSMFHFTAGKHVLFCQQVKQKPDSFMHSTSSHTHTFILCHILCSMSFVIKCDINWFRKSIFQTFKTLANYGPRTLSMTRKTELEQSCSVTNNLISLSFLYSSVASIKLHKEHIEEQQLTFTWLQNFHTWT